MNTPEEIKKLILQARSFTPVNLTAQSGATINVQLGYGSVRATALTPVTGNAIAFQTDQGNWYVIGESSNNIAENNGESRRQISYRVVRPKPDLAYPVKTIFLGGNDLWTFNLGGDQPNRKLRGNITEPLLLNNVQMSVVNLGKGDKYSASVAYQLFKNPGWEYRLFHVKKNNNQTDLRIPTLSIDHNFYHMGDNNWVANRQLLGVTESDQTIQQSIPIPGFTTVLGKTFITNHLTYYLVDNGVLTEKNVDRTIEFISVEENDGLYANEDTVTYNGKNIIIGGVNPYFGGFQGFPGVPVTPKKTTLRVTEGDYFVQTYTIHTYDRGTLIHNPISNQTVQIGGVNIRHEESEATVDLNYVFLRLAEDISISHELNLTYKRLFVEHFIDTRDGVPEGNISGQDEVYLDYAYTFNSWITNTESIKLNQKGVIKELNIDKYLLFRPQVNITEETTSFDVFVSTPVNIEAGNYDLLQGFFVSGAGGSATVPQFVEDIIGVVDKANLDINTWKERELYDPTKFIGEEIIYFSWDSNPVNPKHYVVKGVISNVIFPVENTFGFGATFTINITSKTLAPSLPETSRNCLFLNNGSFFNFALRFFVGDLVSRNVLFCKEILKAVTFTHDAPLIERNSKTNMNLIGGEVGNIFYGNNPNNPQIPIKSMGSVLMSRINIINNKIYEVIEDPYLASKKKAAIAEWTITEDGKIMFEKIFTVPYLLNFISPMRSSYNPK